MQVTPPVTVRRAVESDLDSLCALLQRYYGEWDIWQRDPPAAVFQALLAPDLGFVVAASETQLAGCVLCRPLSSPGGAVECKRLFVAPEFRGRGLASRLMDEAEAMARRSGAQWMYLDSKAEFSNALALYRRRGYADVARFNENAQATIFLRKAL